MSLIKREPLQGTIEDDIKKADFRVNLPFTDIAHIRCFKNSLEETPFQKVLYIHVKASQGISEFGVKLIKPEEMSK